MSAWTMTRKQWDLLGMVLVAGVGFGLGVWLYGFSVGFSALAVFMAVGLVLVSNWIRFGGRKPAVEPLGQPPDTAPRRYSAREQWKGSLPLILGLIFAALATRLVQVGSGHGIWSFLLGVALIALWARRQARVPR